MPRSFVCSILVFVFPTLMLPLYSRPEPAQSFSPVPPEAQAAMAELQKEAFRAHMAFLADDLLEGRGTGARGHEIAARYSSLEAVVARAAARLGSKVTPDPEPDQHLFIRADQYSFVRQGVPSVFISEGQEAKDPAVDGKKFMERWVATRYHAPSDDMNQPLNLDAAVEFMQIDFLVGYDIAQDPQRPRWKPGDFFGENFAAKN